MPRQSDLRYTFEHRADGHTLILTDRVGGLGTIGTHSDCPVLYQPMGGGDSMEPALNRFHYTEQVRTARQVQRDYTFIHPYYNQQHTATGDQDLNNQHQDYERFDYPGRYKRDIAGKPFTKTRLAALRNDAKLAHVAGDDARLQPGLAFDLNEHPREDFNDRWRTIAIRHEGKQHSSLLEEAVGSDSGTFYEMKASAIRWTSDWKAPLRDKPCIDGPQIATVVGPPGEEIYCDEWGRVKVQFPQTISGQHHLTAGQGMHHTTTVYQLQASERVVFQSPGGSLTLDAQGIHLNGVAITLHGPVTSTTPGAGQALTLQLQPEAGQTCVEKNR